jgi:hypothetical protein
MRDVCPLSLIPPKSLEDQTGGKTIDDIEEGSYIGAMRDF